MTTEDVKNPLYVSICDEIERDTRRAFELLKLEYRLSEDSYWGSPKRAIILIEMTI
jgi:hypothetical protein